jgi:hypothetical protein
MDVAAIHPTDTLNYKLINSLALKGDIKQILLLLDKATIRNEKDSVFKKTFEKRFKFRTDLTDAVNDIPDGIRPLAALFHNYWRNALLHPATNDNHLFKARLRSFLEKENKQKRFIRQIISDRNLAVVYKAYIHSKGYFATDFGKTGFLYDFIAWKKMNPEPYTIELLDDTVHIQVNFIDAFISLGWISYARAGTSSPGGWATKAALYCVKNGYDTTSEKFHLSYLKHEGQHFSDYKHFGELPSRDLEYRGKLLEIFYADKELLSLLQSFIAGAKYDKNNAHPFANYCIVRNLARLIFQKEFEEDMERWRSTPKEVLQQAAKQLYKESTKALQHHKFLNE